MLIIVRSVDKQPLKHFMCGVPWIVCWSLRCFRLQLGFEATQDFGPRVKYIFEKFSFREESSKKLLMNRTVSKTNKGYYVVYTSIYIELFWSNKKIVNN